MKRALAPLVLLVFAFAADAVFTSVSGHEGLLAPFGPVHASTVISGALALGTRLVATVVALPWLAWRLEYRVRQPKL